MLDVDFVLVVIRENIVKNTYKNLFQMPVLAMGILPSISLKQTYRDVK